VDLPWLESRWLEREQHTQGREKENNPPTQCLACPVLAGIPINIRTLIGSAWLCPSWPLFAWQRAVSSPPVDGIHIKLRDHAGFGV
jgi:hypothetical protein